MMRMKYISLMGVVGVLLSACAPAGTSSESSVAGSVGLVADAAPVSAKRAKAIVDGVCGASLPNFASAPKQMAANGFTRSSPMGTATVYSETDNASVQIKDGPGMGKTCSVVIATKDKPETVRREVMGPKVARVSVPGSQDSPYGALYRGRNVMILSDPETHLDGLTYMNFQMLSER